MQTESHPRKRIAAQHSLTRTATSVPKLGKGGRGKAAPAFAATTMGLGPNAADKVVAGGIKLYNQRSIVEERSIGSHGHFFQRTNDKTVPRHRRPADPSRLRPRGVFLSDH